MRVHPRVFCVDPHAGTRTRGSVPALRPAFALRVRGIPRVRVRVAHLRPAGLPVLLPTDHSAVSFRQGPTQSDGHTKASDALPDSRADVPIFGRSLLTVPDRTCTVTYRDRTAHLGLALCSLNSLRSRELAKYKIQYL